MKLKISRWHYFLISWVALAEAIVNILTLGTVWPGWCFRVMVYFTLKELEKIKEENEKSLGQSDRKDV
jgi:hypothetical protein